MSLSVSFEDGVHLLLSQWVTYKFYQSMSFQSIKRTTKYFVEHMAWHTLN